MLGSAKKRKPRVPDMKIFLKYSNLCHHDAATSQTARRTDGRFVVATPRSAYAVDLITDDANTADTVYY